MAQTGLEDSKDPWRYMIVLSKFIILVIDGGIVKSFGVLIHAMVLRYDSDYKTIGFICSFSSFMYVTSPIANFLTTVVKPQILAITGGFLAAVLLMCIPLTNSVYLLGVVLVLAGFGNTLAFVPLFTSINTFFPKSFILVDTLTQFGTPCGAFAVPVIIERSLEAYGYQGAFLILGGIALHSVVSAACIRTPRILHRDVVHPEATELKETPNHPTENYSPEEDRASKTEQGRLLQLQDIPHSSSHTESEEPPVDPVNKEFVSPMQRAGCPSSCRQWLSSSILITEPLFTLVVPAIFLEGYLRNAWMLFLVPHAECMGIAQSKAVLLSTLAGFCGLIGKITYPVLIYFKVNFSLIFCLASLVCATSFFIDSFSSTFLYLAIVACLQGFCMFLLMCFPTAVVKLSVRNESNMPSALSFFLFVQALGAIIGDTASGHIFDVSSSCSTVFIWFGIILIAVAVNLAIFFFVDRYYERSRSSLDQ